MKKTILLWLQQCTRILLHFTDVKAEERNNIRNALLEYCKLDTEGLIDILNALCTIVEK